MILRSNHRKCHEMLYLVFLFGLLVTAKTQDLSTVNYTFDIDFYKNFNHKRCDGKSVWRLVRYDVLDIEPPYHESDKGIQAVRKSCASSFPISFFGGHLEVNLYVQAVSQKFSVSVAVFDEDDTSISNYLYSSKSEGFGPGWQTITVEITCNKRVKGYVQFRGRCSSNEILVIDSFRYVPNNTKIDELKKVKRSVTFVNRDATENINYVSTTDQEEENEKFENSGRNDISPKEEEILRSSGVSIFGGTLDRETDSTTEVNKASEPNGNSIWNSITIFLVTLGIVLVAAITAVSSYHCGKIRAMHNALPSLSIDDIEPPPSISIPRVTGAHLNI